MPRIGTIAALSLACALGCDASARERECAAVREILEPPPAAPRRDYDYSRPEAPALPPIERLRQATWKDDEVRAAVQAMLAEAGAWETYSPYSSPANPQPATDRLAALCGLRRFVIVDE